MTSEPEPAPFPGSMLSASSPMSSPSLTAGPGSPVSVGSASAAVSAFSAFSASVSSESSASCASAAYTQLTFSATGLSAMIPAQRSAMILCVFMISSANIHPEVNSVLHRFSLNCIRIVSIIPFPGKWHHQVAIFFNFTVKTNRKPPGRGLSSPGGLCDRRVTLRSTELISRSFSLRCSTLNNRSFH